MNDEGGRKEGGDEKLVVEERSCTAAVFVLAATVKLLIKAEKSKPFQFHSHNNGEKQQVEVSQEE